MLEVYIFTAFLFYSGFAVPLCSIEGNDIECIDFPDCSKDSCLCIHPSEIYCNAYYICINGSPKKFICSVGLLFNGDRLTCDYENNVDCKNKTLVPPSTSSTQVPITKDLDYQTTIKYTHVTENETTPISMKDLTSTQTNMTEINSTLTTHINGDDETKYSTLLTTNVTEISISLTGEEILSSTSQTNTTNQSQISNEDTLETTELSLVTNDGTSETTEQSIVSNEDTSETTEQSRVSDDDSSETNQSEISDDDTLMTTYENKDSNEDNLKTTNQGTEENTSTTENPLSTIKIITKQEKDEKPTTFSIINTETVQNNITQSFTITSDPNTSSESFTKHNTLSTMEYISTQEQSSVETSNITEELAYNFTCPSRFGLFADIENCNYFYQCSHFIPYHMQCPSDLHFNPVLQVCDWPYEAGCKTTSDDLKPSTPFASTKISTFRPTNISSSTIAPSTIRHTRSDEIESTSGDGTTTINTIPHNETTESISENSTHEQTLVSGPSTVSVSDITTATSNNTKGIIDIKTTPHKMNNFTDPETEDFSDSSSLIENNTQPITENETFVNTSKSSENTYQYDLTPTSSSITAETAMTGDTSESILLSTDSANITEIIWDPQTNNDSYEITDDFITFKTEEEETTVSHTSFITNKSTKNFMNDTTLNPEASSKSEIVETTGTSEANIFENKTENIKNGTDEPEQKASSTKSKFEYTDTDLLSTVPQNVTVSNTFETSSIITTPEHDHYSVSTGEENQTTTYTETKDFVTPNLTSSVSLVSISTKEIHLLSTTNDSTTEGIMWTTQSDKRNLTTENISIDISTEDTSIVETSTNEIVQNFTCISRFGLFPDPENCNYFFQCSNFIPYHIQCPSDLHFNPILEVCDWPYEAGCVINSTDSPKEKDKHITLLPQSSTTSNITSTYPDNSTDETTENETISIEEERFTKSNKILTSLEPTKPSSTVAPHGTTLNETTVKEIGDYSTIISTNSTKDVEIKMTSTDEEMLTTLEIHEKNSSDFSTINFPNSTTEGQIDISTVGQEFTTHNKNDFSTTNFKVSTTPEIIEVTRSTIQEIVTRNNSEYSTITFRNSTKEVEFETTSSTKLEFNTKNDSDYKTVSFTNYTEAETNINEKEFTTGETKHTLDFECPSQFGLYPDQQNCSRFYQCSHWITNHMDCPSELHFNPILQVCDWPSDAGCILQETSTINEIKLNFECPSRFGLFPDINSCSRFYQCSQWISHLKECPPGLHFNAAAKVCDSPYEARCDNSVRNE